MSMVTDRLAWINDDSTSLDYPGPGWHADAYEPTIDEEAEDLGFRLGWDGDPRPDAADLTVPTSVYEARIRGYIVGRCRRAYHDELERLRAIDAEREEAEYHAWLDGLAREREAEIMAEDGQDWHPAEVVEAVGSVEARKG